MSIPDSNYSGFPGSSNKKISYKRFKGLIKNYMSMLVNIVKVLIKNKSY